MHKFSIDNLTPSRTEEWTPLRRQLKDWRQGDVIASVPATWITPKRDDVITQQVSQVTEWAPIFSDELVMPWAVIVTQTCDLGAKPPGTRKPMLQVCPVLPASAYSASVQADARRGNVVYLYPIKVKPSTECFADLRLCVPLSKALLLECSPVPTTLDDEDRHQLAEKFAFAFRRPALPDEVSETLSKAIATFVGANATHPAVTEVEQVRIELRARTWRSSSAATLYVFGYRRAIAPEEQALWHENLNLWAGILKPIGMTLHPMVFTTPDECSALAYRNSHPLNIRGLRNAPGF